MLAPRHLSLLLLLPAGCRSTSSVGHERVRVPEPMVFDLVRGLGAEEGELEANVLVIAPLAEDDPSAPLVAPEIEYALADGFALEFELPASEEGLEAVKLAAQWTFDQDAEAGFIHGAQALGERLIQVDGWDLTLVYIPAWRFDATWSALFMLGATALFGPELENELGGIANGTLFADLDERWVFGFEVDALLFPEGASTLFMPQLHWEASQHLRLQFGAGVMWLDGETLGPELLPPDSAERGWFPQVSTRLVWEF